MNQLFVFMDNQTTCFHYLFYYKLIGMFLNLLNIYPDRDTVPLKV